MGANSPERAHCRFWDAIAKIWEGTYPYFVGASTATLLLSAVPVVCHWGCQSLGKYQLHGDKRRREKLTVVFYSELMQKAKNFTSTL